MAIDYDADDDDATCWDTSARVQIGTGGGATQYGRNDGNSQSIRVWNVRDCKGDFTSDGAVNSTDEPLFDVALNTPSGGTSSYEWLWAGLEGSRIWHGDCNYSGGFTSADEPAFLNLISTTCCAGVTPSECPGDADGDFDVDLSDLSVLLANFGS